MLTLSKTTSPPKLFTTDCITLLYIKIMLVNLAAAVFKLVQTAQTMTCIFHYKHRGFLGAELLYESLCL